MSYPSGWRPHIESALSLDLRCMFQQGALRAGSRTAGNWHWTCDGEETASIGYCAALGTEAGTLTLNYTAGREGDREAVTCTIRLVTLPRHYGGYIWYFVCPYTGRRARKLYKWSGIAYFCHREAIRPRPTYACQRVSGLDRIMARRWTIRRKLGDNVGDLLCEPFKPKWMRWRTFERHCRRDRELAARENAYFAGFIARLGFLDKNLG